jgi:hypothetical protein
MAATQIVYTESGSRYLMVPASSLFLVFLISIFNLMAVPESQNSSEKEYLEIMPVTDFEVTGDGSSPQWNRAQWEIIPKRSDDRIKYETRLKSLYSPKGIYFLIYCEDKVINATMQDDNLNLWEEDVVEVFLMPEEEYPVYFEYQISPLNYELTLLIPNMDGDRRFLGWLPWNYEGDKRTRRQTRIHKDDDGNVTGWTAEFFIPFKLMEPLVIEPPAPGTKWRANFYRLDYDEGTARFSWQKTDVHFHEPHSFGTIIFR